MNPCKRCGAPVKKHGARKCNRCYLVDFCGKFDLDKPISFYFRGTGSNRFTLIRSHARFVVDAWPKACSHCGYDLHVEIAHRKGIALWSPDTPLRTVNDPRNLILMCRNHHWEFENGLLEMGAEAGFAPAIPSL